MASERKTAPEEDADKPRGYQPSTGRKVFMLVLCLAGLIFVWTYYFLVLRKH